MAALLALLREVGILLEHLPDKDALHSKLRLEPVVEDVLDEVPGKYDVLDEPIAVDAVERAHRRHSGPGLCGQFLEEIRVNV